MSNETTGYNRTQIALHWLIAILIFAAFLTHEPMHQAFDQRLEEGVGGFAATPHTVLGGLALVLIVIRLIVRFGRGAPAPVGTPLVVAAATWGHRALYLLMLATPILGAMAWYGLMPAIGDIHELFGKLLILLALGHAGMAIWHQVVKKDGTLTRMVKSG